MYDDEHTTHLQSFINEFVLLFAVGLFHKESIDAVEELLIRRKLLPILMKN